MDFHLPTRILFGRGRVAELRSNLPADIERVMIVSDPHVAEASGALAAIERELSGLQYELFRDVEPNPSFETVEKGAALARNAGSQLVLGVGGGSPMDAAKGIAVLTTNNGSMKDYMGGEELRNDPLPVACVPTTSGTGSEVTPFAVFTDPVDQSKGGYSDPRIFPAFSIVDPELTFSMSDAVVIDTGLDALTHAIEAYLSTLATPMSDLYALRAIEIASDRLPSASTKGTEAMCDLSYAAMIAGVAITHTSTILLHVMGYPLTVFHGVPHGRANASLLPAFMKFMKVKSSVPERVSRIEEVFRPLGGCDRFIESLGVSTDLAVYGVKRDQLDLFLTKCLVKGDLKITPAPTSAEDIRSIYESAMSTPV